MNFEWYERQADSLVLLSASFGEGKANYLWLRPDDAIQPRSYVVLWMWNWRKSWKMPSKKRCGPTQRCR